MSISYSLFSLSTPLFRGFGGATFSEGVCLSLVLPVYPNASRAYERLSGSSLTTRVPVPDQLFQFLRKYPSKEPPPFTFSPAPLFFQRVYRALLQVPLGETVTYQELALEAGSPRGARAVGQAMRANRLPLIVPCHRVVSQKGLGGYAYGVSLKERILAAEAFFC